jgi:branched-chain amino acid transport system permease protein
MRLTARRYTIVLAAITAAAFIAVDLAAPRLNPYFMQIIIYIAINAILAVSLNLISGFTGQLNLGHAGFMAVGAYLSAAITYYFGDAFAAALGRAGMPHAIAGGAVFLIALLLGGLLAAACGLLVGLPTLRLRGDYLAIATLGFGEIIRIIIVQLEVVGAARGFYGIPQHTTFLWAYAWAAVTIIAVRNLMASAHGRALASVREDELAAQVVGIDTVRYKVVAFAIGAFFAGVAGGLFGHYLMYLNPSMFGFLRSIEIVLMVVLGGMGSIAGSAAGAAILTILPEALRTLIGLMVVGYCAVWAALLVPAFSVPGRARRFAAATMALGVVATFVALMMRVELTGVGARSTAMPWLALGMLIVGEFAVMGTGGRRRSSRAAIGFAVGAAFCVVLLWPQVLPPSVAAARDWLNTNVNQLRMVIYSILLIALMLARPQGIFGKADLTWRALRSVLPFGPAVKRRVPA